MPAPTLIARIVRRCALRRPLLLLLLALPLLGGCETLAYHWQAASGHLRLLAGRAPLTELAADPATPPALRAKLHTLADARRYASDALGLPDNRSYTLYAPLPHADRREPSARQALVWNVVAAPEFSLAPKRWCFPVAGCVSYRGYFARGDAEAKAAELAAAGYDVLVRPAAAYSTLGWFADPLPEPVLQWRTEAIVRLMFHELAHQQLYVPGDTRFNESYASAVGGLGLQAWRRAQGEAAAVEAPSARARIARILEPTYAGLRALYASTQPAAAKRAAKAALLEQARARYAAARAESAAGLERWADWFAALNNARLAGFADYSAGVAAFHQLYADCEQRWDCFHAGAAQLAENPARRRAFVGS